MLGFAHRKRLQPMSTHPNHSEHRTGTWTSGVSSASSAAGGSLLGRTLFSISACSARRLASKKEKKLEMGLRKTCPAQLGEGRAHRGRRRQSNRSRPRTTSPIRCQSRTCDRSITRRRSYALPTTERCRDSGQSGAAAVRQAYSPSGRTYQARSVIPAKWKPEIKASG